MYVFFLKVYIILRSMHIIGWEEWTGCIWLRTGTSGRLLWTQ